MLFHNTKYRESKHIWVVQHRKCHPEWHGLLNILDSYALCVGGPHTYVCSMYVIKICFVSASSRVFSRALVDCSKTVPNRHFIAKMNKCVLINVL